jgi:hypothetical protein
MRRLAIKRVRDTGIARHTPATESFSQINLFGAMLRTPRHQRTRVHNRGSSAAVIRMTVTFRETTTARPEADGGERAYR